MVGSAAVRKNLSLAASEIRGVVDCCCIEFDCEGNVSIIEGGLMVLAKYALL